jgi:prepilin-type N-terminal cleavage/methylation domain-containing protein
MTSSLKNRGFTLVELLVVISIIGLLSSVVLAALNGARQKGQVAAGIQFADNNFHLLGLDAIGYWNFNEGIGQIGTNSSGPDTNSYLPAKDFSIHNRPLTAVVSVPFFGIPRENSTTPANSGSAASISGGQGYLQANNMSGSDLSPTSVTVSAWVYFPLHVTANGTLVRADAGGPTYLELSVLQGSFNYGCYSGLTPDLSTIQFGSLETGKWHHIACSVSSGKSLTIFYDGRQISRTVSTTPGSLPPINAIAIGNGTYNNATSEYLDDVAVYSSALTADQAAELYASDLSSHQFAVNVE